MDNAASGTERRGRLSHQAYEHVKALLLDGHFKPGEQLPVDGLAGQLGMSRQPVMEAMRLLSIEELVEIVPQVGCRVVSPTAAEIGDFYKLFSRMEGLAAELTSSRHEPGELRRLRRVSSEIGELGDTCMNHAQRARDYRLLNREFHGLIHIMARSPSLARLASSLWDRGDFYIYSTSQHPLSSGIEEAQKEHEVIISAIERRDSTTARQLMETHLLGFGERLIIALDAAAGKPAVAT